MGTVIALCVIVAVLGGIVWQLARIHTVLRLGNALAAKHLELVVARGKAVQTSQGRELLRQRLADRMKDAGSANR